MERLPFERKFRWNFPSNGTSNIFGTENRNGIELYRLQNTSKFYTFSRHEACMALASNQTNGTEHFARFGKNGEKGNTTKDITFSRKIFSGMNRSILILHGISRLSTQDIQMVSAHDVTEDSLARLLCEPHFFEHFSEQDISFFA